MNNDTIHLNNTLVSFLRNLATSIEREELSSCQLQRVGEFYIRYRGEEELEKNNVEKEEYSQDEFIKFLFMGFYIYHFLLPHIDSPE